LPDRILDTDVDQAVDDETVAARPAEAAYRHTCLS